MLNDHPAVKTHLKNTEKVSGDEEKNNIPNHSEIEQYLSQLPTGIHYKIHDYESNTVSEKDQEVFETTWEEIGLRVNFTDDERGYGSCFMVKNKNNGEVGLGISVNGGVGASSITYFVVPTHLSVIITVK